MKPFQPRSLVSLSIAAGFLVLTVTGLLLYFLKHSVLTAGIHTSFALVFLIAAGFHVRNNWKSLRQYSRKPEEKSRVFFRKELYLALLPAAALLAGMLYELPGFSAVYAWGNEIRLKQENKRESNRLYQYVETNVGGRGVKLELEARKGPAFQYPLFAVWIEDTAGRFLQTLYVSRVIGTSWYDFGKDVGDDEWVPAIVRRPEALPYWGHQRGIQARDGYFLPDPDSPVADTVSGATPNQSFHLSTRTDEPLMTFRLLLEVNQSWDWNDYYTPTRFPEDKIYSGKGQNGQPSAIYAATIDLTQDTQYYALNPVGHGHPGGGDGKLYPDLSNMTTALEIIDGVLVKIIR